MASHERLREKRRYLAGVQAFKSRFFAPIYRKYLYSLLSSLYYAGSPKVPPRVFGPLGSKTLWGQLKQWIALMARADWLVKLRISCAIYFRATREKMASGLHL